MHAQTANPLLLRPDLLWDGLRLHHESALLIQDGRVAEIGPAALQSGSELRQVRRPGCTLLPPLADAHLHLAATAAGADGIEQALRTLGRAGVGICRDLGAVDPAVFQSRRSHLTEVVCSGRPLAAEGGIHGTRLVRDRDQAIAAVRETAACGATVIKLFATFGIASERQAWDAVDLPAELIQVATATAHALGLRVAAHALSRQGVRNAVKAGVDTVEHGLGLDDETAAEMAARGIVLVPTLSIYARFGNPAVVAHPEPRIRDRASTVVALLGEVVRRAARAGVIIGTGTDQGVPHNPIQGPTAETRALVDAGLSALEALTAATVGSAAAIDHASYSGRIERGASADLLLVEGDPSSDIDALGRVVAVYRSGQEIASGNRDAGP